MLHRTTVRRADLIGGIVSAGLGDRTAHEKAEAIVTASALNNRNNAQAAPTSRFARDIRVRWRVPLPLHLIEIRVTPQRMLHAVLDRMKCEAEQRAEERFPEMIGCVLRNWHDTGHLLDYSV
jgi:hypothetical protein